MKKIFARIICIMIVLTCIFTSGQPVQAADNIWEQFKDGIEKVDLPEKWNSLIDWTKDRAIDAKGLVGNLVKSTTREGYRYNNRPETPVLNAVINGKWGDERSFVKVADLNDDKPHGHSISLKKGHTYQVIIYFINDCKKTLDAKDVSLFVDLPGTVTKKDRGEVVAILSSNNTEPKIIFDSVILRAKTKVRLEYIDGSMKILNGGKLNGEILSADKTFNLEHRLKLGYDKLDGKLPAGKLYAGKVIFKFKTS